MQIERIITYKHWYRVRFKNAQTYQNGRVQKRLRFRHIYMIIRGEFEK